MRKWRAVCCRSHSLMPREPLGLGRRGHVAQREGAGGRDSLRVHTCVCWYLCVSLHVCLPVSGAVPWGLAACVRPASPVTTGLRPLCGPLRA